MATRRRTCHVRNCNGALMLEIVSEFDVDLDSLKRSAEKKADLGIFGHLWKKGAISIMTVSISPEDWDNRDSESAMRRRSPTLLCCAYIRRDCDYRITHNQWDGEHVGQLLG